MERIRKVSLMTKQDKIALATIVVVIAMLAMVFAF